MSEYTTLKSSARRLEQKLQSKLESYARFATKYAQNELLTINSDVEDAGGQTVDHALCAEIEKVAAELNRTLDQLSQAIERSAGDDAARGQQYLQHFRIRARDLAKDYQRTRAEIQATTQHAALLSSVRSDLYKGKNAGAGGVDAATDHLLRERTGIAHSTQTMDSLLLQAEGARESLRAQTRRIQGAVQRLGTTSGVFRDVQGTMRGIWRRKKRDTLILAGFISLLILFLLRFSVRG